MKRRLIWNDIRNHKLITITTCAFMAICAILIGITAMLFMNLYGAIDHLMEIGKTPSFLQMHAGAMDAEQIEAFACERQEVEAYEIGRFLNLENGMLYLGGDSLADSSQDNGLWIQNREFDYLVDLNNTIIQPVSGQVYVPVCYQREYDLQVGDTMEIGSERLVIAGFLRDSQMNSMMASSKRFLVSSEDYERLFCMGIEEYLIEFRLTEGADVNVFATAYSDAGLPNNGPTITFGLVKMMNALSDGMMILIILLVSVVVLLISMLCIRYILSTSLEKDQREIGMLKAVGISKVQIRHLYLSKFLVLSVTGGMIGLIVAYFCSQPLAHQMHDLYGQGENVFVIIGIALLSVILVEGILLLSIRRNLRRIEKMSAVDALRGSVNSQKTGKKNYLTIAVIIGIGVFLMVVPAAIASTMASPKFVTYMGIGNGELRVDIRQTEQLEEKAASLRLELAGDNRVREQVLLYTSSCLVKLSDGQNMQMLVERGEHTIFPVQYADGRCPARKGEMAISYLYAKELGLQVGDTLEIEKGMDWQQYEICGIYSDITNGGKTAKVYCPSMELLEQPEEAVMWCIVYLSLVEGVDRQAFVEDYRDRYDADSGIKIIDIADYLRHTYGQTMHQLKLASMVAYIVAGVIIFMVVTLFLRLVLEKMRMDCSLKKALGYTTKEVRIEFWQNISGYLISGIVLGILVGTTLGEKLVGGMLESLGATDFSFILSIPKTYVWTPIYTGMIAGMAAMTAVREIKKIDAYECCVGKE